MPNTSVNQAGARGIAPSAAPTSALVAVIFATLALPILSGCSHLGWPARLAGPEKSANRAKRHQASEPVREAADSNRQEALLLAAETRWREGETADCERLLHQLLEAFPSSADGRRMLAELYLSTDRPGQASAEFERLLAEIPDSLELQYQYAVSLESTGRIAESEAILARIAARAAPQSWLADAAQRPAPGSLGQGVERGNGERSLIAQRPVSPVAFRTGEPTPMPPANPRRETPTTFYR
jgi:outer membrane PBP1 activator LpoA protein